MPVKRPPRVPTHLNLHARTQGIALVVVLLAAMILMVSLLAISSTMTISSQRTTGDQNSTLQAQYAAEAGLAQVSYRLAEANTLLQTLNVSTTSSSASAINTAMRTHAQNYCNTSLATLPTGYESYRNWSSSDKANGVLLCTVQAGTNSNRYSLFSTYIPTGYPTGTTATTYWPTVFSIGTPASTSVKIASTSTSETWYKINYQLFKPTKVILVQPNYYRFYFNVVYNGASSQGELRTPTSQVVASRTISRQFSTKNKEYFVEVQLPSFARNFVFRNKTTNTSGGQLYFAGGETFDGPVYTNGKPGFYKLNGQVPIFRDSFSTCSTSGTYTGYSGSTANDSTTADMKNTFQGGREFGVPSCIGMPDNSYNQLSAAFGGSTENVAPVPCSDLAGKWGLKVSSSTCKTFVTPPSGSNLDYSSIPTGVFYSKGNPSSGTSGSPNSGNTWLSDTGAFGGGIYVKGNVDDLLLSVATSGTNKGKQIIQFKQGTTTTRFEEQLNGDWVVKNGAGVVLKTLTGTFNGLLYVDGNITNLHGNGTTTGGKADPDIASQSQLTVTATGQVVIKDDITYTDDPTTDDSANPNDGMSANNVLGIYSSGDKCGTTTANGKLATSCGSVLVDGGLGEDITVNASIMASYDGEGFGAVKYNQPIGSVLDLLSGITRKARINLTGGIIEDQSQTVGDVNSNGYARAYKYDPRFKDGLVKPPFFPERTAQWQTMIDPFIDQQQVWQTVGS